MAFYASAVQKETRKKKELLPVKGSCCRFTSPPPLPAARLGSGSTGCGERRRRRKRRRLKGTLQKCPGSGTEVSRAELCPGSWPCSAVVCGRRWLWRCWRRRSEFSLLAGRFPSSASSCLSNPRQRSCCWGDYFIAASCSFGGNSHYALSERQGRGDCHSGALEKTEG